MLPLATVNETPRTARTAPKLFCTSASSSAGFSARFWGEAELVIRLDSRGRGTGCRRSIRASRIAAGFRDLDAAGDDVGGRLFAALFHLLRDQRAIILVERPADCI